MRTIIMYVALHSGAIPLPTGAREGNTVALANVLDWARPQEQPIIVIPGADHFFHGKLHLIRELIARNVDRA